MKRLKKDGKLNNSKQVVLFRELAEKKLFDISLCKCKDFLSCSCTIKVPVLEREFLTDQRTSRKMVIGRVDQKTTKVLEKRWKRKSKTEERRIRHDEYDDQYKESLIGRAYQTVSSNLEEETSNNSSSEENVIKLEDRVDTPSTSQMRIKLPSVAQACNRTGVSDRTAAILVGAALKDIGIITTEDSSKIVDRSKIRRERAKARVELKIKDKEDSSELLYGIYFDGRKDQTLVQTSEEGSLSKKTKTEEHIFIVSEPGSKYIGHLTPASLAIRKATGCDGTAVNTGNRNGIIRQLELSLNRSLQWFVCLLHANELPLRHLLQHLDGKTTGPKGFRGEIGKQLEKCETLQPTKFKRIEITLPEISADHRPTILI
uniref:Uncharacterized protein LOC114334377 n=1 Tax=Diabrotica virgifera virgifera TaxID=50390 RepID=A0A6P7FUT2_DIAVI